MAVWGLVTSPDRAEMDSPCRRAELEERMSLYVLYVTMNPTEGVRMWRDIKIMLSVTITVTAILSKNWGCY
ncbi:MAG: hypothetical protein KJ717_11435 [Proteobacteria bacterium]|nr:hypothetical protein [Pseudomonadota bacterium]